MFLYILAILVVLFVLYILALMPKIINRRSLEDFMGPYYAHRGLHQDKSILPENSLAAFQLAVENSYGIELDIRLSKDGEPVIFHDANLKRVCGIDKYVKDLSFNELRELRLYNSNERIPHLQEVLDLVNGQIPLIVEFKLESIDTRICQIVAPYLDNYMGLYCVESFHPAMVNWYKKNRPHIIRGQLSANQLLKESSLGNKILNYLLRNLFLNFWGKPDFIAYEHNFGNNISLNICRKLFKTPTIAYTIQSQRQLDKALKYFDIFIFDSFIPRET